MVLKVVHILLTYSVKIRGDNCYPDTVNAPKNFTQHFVYSLLHRTDVAIP